MTEVKKNSNTIPIEEEFSRLGFDYKSMMEKALYVKNDYAILIESTILSINSDQNYHDEVHIEFGVDCTKKREPSRIHNMTVKLMRYGGNAYEGQELVYTYYHRDKGLPTKDQICAEMGKILRIRKIREQAKMTEVKDGRVNHAKEVHAKFNQLEQNNPNTLRRKL